MKYQILKQFNPTKDILTESQLREIRYDIGELKAILKNNELLNIFDLNSSKESIFYNLKTLINSKKTTHTLIYIPDLSLDSFNQLKKINDSSKNIFYFIDHHNGEYKDQILKLLSKKSISPLNFIMHFRKSNFNNWKIIILHNKKLDFSNIVLNTFLALGAIIDHRVINTKKIIFFKNISLSFQHSIDLYKMK